MQCSRLCLASLHMTASACSEVGPEGGLIFNISSRPPGATDNAGKPTADANGIPRVDACPRIFLILAFVEFDRLSDAAPAKLPTFQPDA